MQEQSLLLWNASGQCRSLSKSQRDFQITELIINSVHYLMVVIYTDEETLSSFTFAVIWYVVSFRQKNPRVANSS